MLLSVVQYQTAKSVTVKQYSQIYVMYCTRHRQTP